MEQHNIIKNFILSRRFKKPSLNLNKFRSEIDDECAKVYINEQKQYEYRELLVLSLMFLHNSVAVIFYVLGAVHDARWMAKAIYNINIFLFREFKWTKHKENHFNKYVFL